MLSQRLTDAFVRKVKMPPHGKQISYFDTVQKGKALVLSVSWKGTKSFRALAYINTKPKYVYLGNYPEVTLKAATAEAQRYWHDPARYLNQQDQQAAVGSIEEVIEKWFKSHVLDRKLRSATLIRWMCDKYILRKPKDGGPATGIGKMPFLEFRREQVMELLDWITHNHTVGQAEAVRNGVLQPLFRWWEERHENWVSPLPHKRRKVDKRPPRSRVLSSDEIAQVWKAADDLGTFGAILKMCLLTAQRRTIVATMRWSDLDGATWTLPREDDRQKGVPETIILPRQAMTVIEAQPRLKGCPFVFWGRHNLAFNSFSDGKERLDALLPDLKAFVVHDIRRTARTLMSELGIDTLVAELCIGHKRQGIVAVYDHAKLNLQRAKALQLVADHIDGIVNPPTATNVIPLKR